MQSLEEYFTKQKKKDRIIFQIGIMTYSALLIGVI